MDKPVKLASVQALRAAAALLVLLYHVQNTELRLEPVSMLPNWFVHGSAGVDLFFVISGFVMVWISGPDRGLRAAGSFLFSRALRIYPPAWLFTALAMLGSIAAGTFAARVAADNWALFSFLMMPQETVPALAVSWTIVHEVYFYVVFAVLLLFRHRRSLVIGLVAWGIVVAVAGLAGWRSDGPWATLVVHPLTLEFIAGALVAMALRSWPPWRPGIVLAAGAAVALSLPLILGTKPFAELAGWHRLFAYAPPACAVAYGIIGLEILGRFRCPRWIRFIGDMSYSLYLSHLLVMAVVLQLWVRLATAGDHDKWLMIAAMAVAPLPVAAMSYLCFERPAVKAAHRLRDSIFGGSRATSIALRPTGSHLG